jgi:hypothetical protein
MPALSAFIGDEPTVDFVKLVDEVLDARVVEAHPFDVVDDLRLELLVAPLGYARQRLALLQGIDPLVLKPVQSFVGFCDRVKGRERARLQLRLHRGQRDRALLAFGLLDGELALDLGEFLRNIFAVGNVCVFARLRAVWGAITPAGTPFALDPAAFRNSDHHYLGRYGLEHTTAVSGVEIDDVAQQHLPFV